MVFRTLTKFASGKRIPLIKFRKGGNAPSGSGVSAGGPASSNQASSPAASNTKSAQSGAIEDWELPPRYWRKPIDPIEMEYINRGGPA